LQQIETSPDIWRRASPSPAPRPVLQASATSLLTRPRPLRRRHKFKLLGQTLALLLVSAAAFFVLAGGQRSVGRSTVVVAELERWLELAGFGLQQASVTGYRFTPDGDIFDAIDLRRARTMLTFDSRAAQERIERLPWVDKASIERVLPDRLEVRITERTPFAVWSLGDRNLLIDRSGRELGPALQGSMPALPRIAGEGAPEAAAALFALLAAHPDIKRRVVVAERVGNRRWTLRLAGGGSIALPADGASEALARATALGAAHPARVSEIDLRVAGRTLVREAGGRPDGAAALDAFLASGI
jgi:cell division protein FtsQ